MRGLFILTILIATGIYFYLNINTNEVNANQIIEEDWNDYTLIEENLSEQEKCLSEAFYFEARGEPFLGQVAVGVVIMRRVDSPQFPNNICDVVHDGKYWKGNPVRNKCAFSYYCDGKSERINNEYEYSKVVQAAMLVLQGIVVDNMEDVVYYHATYVNPSWASQKIKAFQIGKHIFYKEK